MNGHREVSHEHRAHKIAPSAAPKTLERSIAVTIPSCKIGLPQRLKVILANSSHSFAEGGAEDGDSCA